MPVEFDIDAVASVVQAEAHRVEYRTLAPGHRGICRGPARLPQPNVKPSRHERAATARVFNNDVMTRGRNREKAEHSLACRESSVFRVSGGGHTR